MSDLTYQDVIRVLELIDRSDCVDLDLASGDLRLKVSRSQAAPAARPAGQVEAAADVASAAVAAPASAPAPAAPTPPAKPDALLQEHPGATPVKAPMGGMFYATPAPGKPPFVTVGQQIRKGDQLGIVEVMKLFTPITAETDGVVVAIAVGNQQTVAKDDVLVLIETRD
ncbi:biotin/lipoyl-containing protein [Maricaulis sp.]|uniref:acetyl-CoA carboxylase biotin carboxyl carrier protein n=1 Tax=Maricaulis sp. TaxID=1486257 RepID=UPI00260AA14B|nr:biotin/lipoyl-containing protein [Maricaulis sp.]